MEKRSLQFFHKTILMVNICTLARLLSLVFSVCKEGILLSIWRTDLEAPFLPRKHPWLWEVPIVVTLQHLLSGFQTHRGLVGPRLIWCCGGFATSNSQLMERNVIHDLVPKWSNLLLLQLCLSSFLQVNPVVVWHQQINFLEQKEKEEVTLLIPSGKLIEDSEINPVM